VHQAARGFQEAADAYARARPAYPPAAVEWMCERLGIGPARRVLDLAAGTGKLTRSLVPAGADVVAVEPIAGMRERLPRKVEALDGTAEAIPLPDASVDAVTVAQAFHWFDAERALGEIHRVLRAGGGLGLIWNTRDERDELQRAITALLERLRFDVTGEVRAPRWHGRSAREFLDASPLFGEVETFETTQRQELDADGVVDRFLSVSFVAAAAPEERDAVERGIRDLVAGRAEPIVLPYVTEVYVAFRRECARDGRGYAMTE
jgi:ubiquinone/menaquinone biosynthesis C-methylase UbiE